ncbi:MAG: SAM-dependent DNA methyltransferase [Anaerolineales bacterium]|nr:SAM-dependent DNA methyltransferase [Anaerolineales bacterium]
MSEISTLVQRVWNYCHILRDDGVSYGDYLEQLTYLLFLKMAGERSPTGIIPPELSWASLIHLKGEALDRHYRHILAELGQGTGLVAAIFRQARSKISDPAKLERLLTLIDQESWTSLSLDVKAAIYEGLLEKHAQDTRSGAGQYFTPRPLIQALVEVMQPAPGQRIADPAAGTGGFLLAAHEFMLKHHSLSQEALRGWEIVDATARLCLMNLYLHGIGADSPDSPVVVGDSLLAHPGEWFDLVLTNPPFGKKSSVTFSPVSSPEARTVVRPDFWAATRNKQLNFLQHVHTLLKPNGKAALVVPDNVLFEGGAGEIIRRKLLHTADVHTLLRLPTGIFYAAGIKANVLFFDARPAGETPQTQTLWIYDLRTGQNFTLKQNPLSRADLDDFVACFNPANRHQRTPTWSPENPQGRWRCYTYEALLARERVNLDIFWLDPTSVTQTAAPPDLDQLALEIVEDLETALAQFRDITADLGNKV